MPKENQITEETEANLQAKIEEAIAAEDSDEVSEEETTDTTEETSTEDLVSDDAGEAGEDTDQETVSDKADESDVADEESEESEEASKEETVVDLLKLYGLDGKFDSEADALASIQHAERTIGNLNYEKQQLLQQLKDKQPSKSTEIDIDKFSENPQQALLDAGYITADQVDLYVQDAIDKNNAKEFCQSKDDFRELRPVMEQILMANPAIEAYGHLDGAKELYRMASELKRQATIKKPKVEVVKSDAENKERAKTVGGKRGGGSKKNQPKTDKFGFTPEDYINKPEEEILSTPGIFGDT